MSSDSADKIVVTCTVLTITAFVIGVITLPFWLWPFYNVWQQQMDGEGQLKKAEYTRQIATLDAQAEVARANGVASANKIVADGLGGPDGYLRYLWIEKVAGSNNQIIYIPADAGMPLLEAGRLPQATVIAK